jgi:membrane protease YdiL (CAAX protease family)
VSVIASGLALCGALLGSYLVTRFVNRKPLAAVGLWLHEHVMREVLGGILLGFLMISGVFLIMTVLGFVTVGFRDLSVGDCFLILLPSVLIFSFGAMFEEVLFRGYPFQTLIQGVTLLPAALIMAALFTASHLGNPNISVIGFVNIAFAGIWLSVAYIKTRNLWLPFGLHFGWNFSQTTIYSLPTSGIEFGNMKFFLVTVSGPDWMTGGLFGPEGGVLATVALIACTWYLLKSDRFVVPVGVITLDSVEDLITDDMARREAGS